MRNPDRHCYSGFEYLLFCVCAVPNFQKKLMLMFNSTVDEFKRATSEQLVIWEARKIATFDWVCCAQSLRKDVCGEFITTDV